MKTIIKILLIIIAVGGIFYFVISRTADKTYNERVANEEFTEPDTYKMSEFSSNNCDLVLNALKNNDKSAIEEKMIDSRNLDDVFEYADWSKLNLDKTVSFGSGSLMSSPDEDGRMDVGELVVVKVGKEKYTLYIQTVVARWGKVEEGISCIAATKEEYLVDVHYGWEWQTDENCARAGEAFPKGSD